LPVPRRRLCMSKNGHSEDRSKDCGCSSDYNSELRAHSFPPFRWPEI
jgi:hypothetical protein